MKANDLEFRGQRVDETRMQESETQKDTGCNKRDLVAFFRVNLGFACHKVRTVAMGMRAKACRIDHVLDQR